MKLFITIFLVFSVLVFGFAENYPDGIVGKEQEAKHPIWEKIGITSFIAGLHFLVSSEMKPPNDLLTIFTASSIVLLWLPKSKKKIATLSWSQKEVKFKGYNGRTLNLDWRDFDAFMELSDQFRKLMRGTTTLAE